MSFKFVDLFCGIGGFHHALKSLGGECVLACDIDAKCRDVYSRNFGLTPVSDIRELNENDVPDHDVLCGGFPCFVVGTRVLTDSGYKKVEDVSFEDELLTHTGKYQKILNRQLKKYSGAIYSITVHKSTRPIQCTEEHPFYTVKWDDTTHTWSTYQEWTPASELTKNHSLLFPVNNGTSVSYLCVPIVNIQISNPPPQFVYNFEVENDNSYCVEGVIVHNCQAFSNAGRKEAMEDSRGTLFYEIARIVSAKKPKYILLENVKHIMKIQKGFVFETILKTFTELGYTMKTVVLSPHQFGVPQNRERVYFMGVLGGTMGEIPIPLKTTHTILGEYSAKYKVKKEVEDAFNAWNETFHILKQTKTKVPVLLDEFKNSDDLSTYSAWKRKYVEENKKIYAIDPEFWDTWMTKHADVLSKRKVYRKLEWQVGSYAEDESIWDHFIQLRQSGMRVKKATFFPTLVAIVQTPIYGPEHRFLTPRECAHLQSFPDSHILHEKDQIAYKQLGNSVNVVVVHHVASYLLAQAS